MKNPPKKLDRRLWILVVGISTLLIGAAYGMAQQSTRLSANDLPLAEAQTIHSQLSDGAAPASVVPKVKTDLSSDSTVFVIITDNTQHVLAASAELNDQIPLPPAGVFSYTQNHDGDSFTWEPVSNVRLATEVMQYGDSSNGGFIITGQSLSQAQDRITKYGQIALTAWAAIIVFSLFVLRWPVRKRASGKN